jgi:hypothetical protein
MTMKAIRTLSAVGLVAGMVATASAVPDATIMVKRFSGYYTTPGGEFTVLGSPWGAAYSPQATLNNGFQTFCLELNELIKSGVAYHAYLNTVAVAGGSGGVDPMVGGDPISAGTAWLYERFVWGVLSGYDYTPGPLGTRPTSAKLLQEAIWWLEDELGPSYNFSANPFIVAVLAAFNDDVNAAKDNYTGNRVRVLNIYGINQDGSTNWEDLKQDMLVYVPEGGMTLVLMGGGLLGLALIRRKE